MRPCKSEDFLGNDKIFKQYPHNSVFCLSGYKSVALENGKFSTITRGFEMIFTDTPF